ncbi:Release factor glutamine methyltransferase [Smittium mucronatum]|uniref:Release factor glutamine methyltransferase n=1 Tax=Smittium mucronatum TaxID=133383 RepID=A0A1R0GW57_9FUNG|nr:Release factor glutamine methyltransferase [Smittium mucronatum]
MILRFRNEMIDWEISVGLDKDIHKYLEIEIVKVSSSLHSGKISCINIISKKSCAGGLIIRKYLYNYEYPVIGNSKLTKKLKNCSDKGLFLTLFRISFLEYGILGLENPEFVCEIPSKFSKTIVREESFFNRKLEESRKEFENSIVGYPENDSHTFHDFDPVHKKPLAYISEQKEFCGFKFHLNEEVLIPRKSTEILVRTSNQILSHFRNSEISPNYKDINAVNHAEKTRILDLGTGSGCILISIIKMNRESMNIAGTGIDISNKALEISEKNSDDLGVKELTNFIKCDFSNLLNITELIKSGPFDLVVCNPPYISIEKKSKMNLSSQIYEPSVALYADDGGYEYYQQIYSSLNSSQYEQPSSRLLTEGSVLLFEVGKGMADEVINIFKGWNVVLKRNDHQGNVRCVGFSKFKYRFNLSDAVD